MEVKISINSHHTYRRSTVFVRLCFSVVCSFVHYTLYSWCESSV